jgi:hypothetical protein
MIAKLVTSAERAAGHLSVGISVLTDQGWLEEGLPFCSVPIGQPFAHLSALSVLCDRYPSCAPEHLTHDVLMGRPYTRTEQ